MSAFSYENLKIRPLEDEKGVGYVSGSAILLGGGRVVVSSFFSSKFILIFLKFVIMYKS